MPDGSGRDGSASPARVLEEESKELSPRKIVEERRMGPSQLQFPVSYIERVGKVGVFFRCTAD